MSLMIIDVTHCDSVIRLSSTVPTLQARMGTGGGQVPLVLSENGNDRSIERDIVPPIKTTTTPVVAFGLHPFITNANADKPHHGPDGDGFIREQSFTLATMGRPKVAADSVRRLTPLECERLQGFPDNWTRIPYKGKSAENCPDSPRYKAIGNSWAVPCVHWLGRMIDAEFERMEGRK